MVERPVEFTFDELLAMSLREEAVTLACVSNKVGEDLVGNAYWLGVPLPTLLREAGVQADATQVIGRAVDGFTVGFPTDVALDGRESMVVFGMNGEPLPAEHGFPARLIVPGLYGYVSATGSVRSQGASTLRRHKATSLVVYAAASSLISECQRVRKSRRCSVNATWAPPRRRTRKYCRSSSNALQKRDADSKLPKPCIAATSVLPKQRVEGSNPFSRSNPH